LVGQNPQATTTLKRMGKEYKWLVQKEEKGNTKHFG
jgi:hypothetical protein